MTAAKFCRCERPAAEIDGDGVSYCDHCGELLPMPLELALPYLLRRMAGLQREIDDLSARLPEPLPAGNDQRLLSAAEVADRFGLSRDYVYEHSERLGAIRLGTGSRARLRFRPELVERALLPASERKAEAPPQRLLRRSSTGAKLLPVRD